MIESIIPPQNIETEEALISCVLINDKCFDDICIHLSKEMFYSEKLAAIYACFGMLLDEGSRIDLITVTNKLRENKKIDEVGVVYITQLTGKVATSSNAVQYALEIKEKYNKRQLIEIFQKGLQSAYDDGIISLDVIEQVDRQIQNINVSSGINVKHIKEALIENLKTIEKAASQQDGITGMATGWREIDKITSGWHGSDLVIVAGRPSMGKTAFAIKTLLRQCEFDRNVLFFSLEMSAEQLSERLLSGEYGESPMKLRSGKNINWNKLESSANRLSEYGFYIDDVSRSMSQVRATARDYVKKHGIKMIAVDYIQIMDGKGGNREQEISAISRGLKQLAREFNILVLGLSQLNRSVDSRPGNRPQLSDLRESGAIEQDADIVIFPFRPKYYNDDYLYDLDLPSTIIINKEKEQILNIIFAKHRRGALGEVLLRCNNSITEIVDLVEIEPDLSKGFEEIKPF